MVKAKAMAMKGGMCPCPHHKWMKVVAGLLVFLGGLVLLLENMGRLDGGTADLWIAILVIVFGLGWMSKGLCKCCNY